MAAVVEALGPGLFGVSAAGDECASGAVEHIVERIAVGHSDQLTADAAHIAFEQHRDVSGVPIVRVVGCELEMPFELTRVTIERYERTRVKVVAAARIRVPVGTGVADS